MSRSSKKSLAVGRRYALCVGIGTYTQLSNRNLRYAVADASAIAEKLGDPERGNFAITLLTAPAQTTRAILEAKFDEMLNAIELKVEDLVVIYLSCHGDTYGKRNTFYLLPSDAELEADGMPKKRTVIDIHDLSKWLSAARVKNVIFLLDVCHSGGAGVVLEHLDLNLNPDANLFIIGAARHDQVAAQSSQLKHGIFTSCLLRAFEQKPNRSDGWLTISDMRSFVSEAINVEASRLSSQESLAQIQARSAEIDPNLPLMKNPHYSPKSREFHKMVKSLLELVQYKPIQTTIPAEAPAGFYVAELKAGLRLHRVGIIPYYNRVEPLTPEDAEEIMLFLRQQVEQGNLDEGLLVVFQEVSREVKETPSSNGIRYLEVTTYESIWKNLIDFNHYLQKLVDEYQSSIPERRYDPPLAKVYISLRAERRHYHVDVHHSVDVHHFTDVAEIHLISDAIEKHKILWEGDLEEEVKRWLANKDPAASRLALLGDYGSGKTTFCQHLATMLAKDYLEAQGHERHEKRIPLIISLREFGRNPVDLKSYLVAYLKQYCRVDNADAEALVKMAEVGLLLFILDGFDEMACRATSDTVSMNIEQFELLAGLSQNKVLLTTRPEYFLNLSQEGQMLQAYPRLYLQPLNKKQVNLYLKKRVPSLWRDKDRPKRGWKYYREQIDSIHDLTDLVRRPVLLEMIIKTLPVLIREGEAVNRPNLYQRYLEGELDRQRQKQRRDLLIKREKRFEIMERIALELYRTNKVELGSKQILDVSRELLTSEQQEEMEGALREIVTCSFLIRTGSEYRFSHHSFLEYLIACRLAKDIMNNKPENFRLKLLTQTIGDFLLELEPGVVQKSSTSIAADNTVVSFDRKQLEAWFRANPKDRWVSNNAISLLAKLLSPEQMCQLPLQGADLREAHLERMDLRGADLRGADLRGADLMLADLEGAFLVGVRLEGAFLVGVRLEGADLRGAFLEGAILEGAHLKGVDLQEAHLERAHLERAHLERAHLERAHLERAHLEGAYLKEADLREADLREADLREADLREADLEGADLEGADLEGAIFQRAEQSQKVT